MCVYMAGEASYWGERNTCPNPFPRVGGGVVRRFGGNWVFVDISGPYHPSTLDRFGRGRGVRISIECRTKNVPLTRRELLCTVRTSTPLGWVGWCVVVGVIVFLPFLWQL